MSSIYELLWVEKYRPRTLGDIINQVEVISRLKKFVEMKNMPHLLFAGPAGTGKTTAAHALAHDLYGENYRQYMLELNASVSRDTPILVRRNGLVRMTNFGELDDIYFGRGGRFFRYGGGEYAEINDLEVLTVDESTGRVVWRRATWLIRHRSAKILRVKLRGGGIIELTGNHSVMVIGSNGALVEKSASQLKPGDHLLSFVARVDGGGGSIGTPGLRDGRMSLPDASFGGTILPEAFVETVTGDTLIHYRGVYTIGSVAVGSTRGGAGFIPDIMYELTGHNRIQVPRGLHDGGETWESLASVAWLARVSGIESLLGDDGLNLVWGELNVSKEPDLMDASPFIGFLKENDHAVSGDWRRIVDHQLGKSEGTLPKRLLLRMLDMVDESLLDKWGRRRLGVLRKLASSDLHVVTIESVELADYNGYVYDLSVPGNNMFFAGRIPVLLHNSDERGIGVIREKVKEFARSRTPAEIPFKIVLLDEADNMTSDAQQALRRLMELYSASTRFILIANYPSKIIDPIQSRCAFFRFQKLSKEDVVNRLRYIAETEGVDYDDEALETIYEISEGDMRKAINILQASAALGKVTIESVFKVVGLAKPKEVREMVKLALKGDFTAARNLMRKLMIEYGLSGEDLIKQIHREIMSKEINIPEETRVLIADYIGEVHFRLTQGSDEDIQLSAFLAWLSMIGLRLGVES